MESSPVEEKSSPLESTIPMFDQPSEPNTETLPQAGLDSVVSPIGIELDLFDTQFDQEDLEENGNYWKSYPTMDLKSELVPQQTRIKVPDNDVGKILPSTAVDSTNESPAKFQSPTKPSKSSNLSKNLAEPPKTLNPRHPLVPQVHLRLQKRPKDETKRMDKDNGKGRMFLDLNEEIPTPRVITPGKDPENPKGDEEYPIERILDRKWVSRGKGINKYEYLVEWEGNFENSWIQVQI